MLLLLFSWSIRLTLSVHLTRLDISHALCLCLLLSMIRSWALRSEALDLTSVVVLTPLHWNKRKQRHKYEQVHAATRDRFIFFQRSKCH